MSDNNKEIWKPIPIDDYRRYEISNKGRCRNTKSNRILIPNLNNSYYTYHLLYKGKDMSPKAHRLVAMAFIPKSDDSHDIVNHKDGNKINNVENLEWTTVTGNAQHSVTSLGNSSKGKKVIRINADGTETIYDNITIAGKENNTSRMNISNVLRGKTKNFAGLKYKYFDKNNEPVELTDKELKKTYKKINDYEFYYISNAGKIYSKRQRQFLAENIVDGFPCVSLWKDSKETKYYIHKLVAEYYVPNPNNLEHTLRIDGNRRNIHYSNLKWATDSEIVLHAKALKDSKKLIENNIDDILPEFNSLTITNEPSSSKD